MVLKNIVITSKDGRFQFEGKGSVVIDQLPRKGEYVEEGDTIVIMLGEK